MPAPSPSPTWLYKILPEAAPSPLPAVLPLSDLDRNDGYIHLSTSEQVPGTADKFFSEHKSLWILKISYEALAKGTDGEGNTGRGEVKWEEVGRGCFAHLYGSSLGAGNVSTVLKIDKTEEKWTDTLSLDY